MLDWEGKGCMNVTSRQVKSPKVDQIGLRFSLKEQQKVGRDLLDITGWEGRMRQHLFLLSTLIFLK